MLWLTKLVDEAMQRHPDGEVVVSSGVSPSGTYHLGTLREVLTAEAIMRELKIRGREASHIHMVDDMDVFRKVPKGLPEDYKKYLGKPLCDIPAPDGSDQSYADYYLAGLIGAATDLRLEMKIVRSHEKYRAGFFVPAIEKALQNSDQIRTILEEVSGRQLDDQYSPIQVIENGYLKNRQYQSIDLRAKTIVYLDGEGHEQTISYAKGDVKLSWRIDWPARWWLMHVQVEPFGRDHATKGGSYDTGAVIDRQVFGAEAPLPVPYDFINRTGETKKMSKSAGDTVTASDLLKILPPELVWFFILRYAPEKQLFFDQGPTLMRLFDEFSELLAKQHKSAADNKLVELCLQGIEKSTVSRVPFTHLVASYQAALKDVQTTLDVMRRTEYKTIVDQDEATIRTELQFIDAWLQAWAPDEVTFSVVTSFDGSSLSDVQKQFLASLADKIAQASADADGEWFHKAVYDLKDTAGLAPKELFATLYQALIGQDSGPRAGWFLSLLPRDWLIKRLRLEA